MIVSLSVCVLTAYCTDNFLIGKGRWRDHPSFTSKPFSINDFNFGAGGTLPTHERILFPATLTVHRPHSPFLQSVGTFIPNFVQACSSWNKQQGERRGYRLLSVEAH